MILAFCSAHPKAPFHSRSLLFLFGEWIWKSRGFSQPWHFLMKDTLSQPQPQPHLGGSTHSLSLAASLTAGGESSLEINLSQLAHSSPWSCEENDQCSDTSLVCSVNERERGREKGREGKREEGSEREGGKERGRGLANGRVVRSLRCSDPPLLWCGLKRPSCGTHLPGFKSCLYHLLAVHSQASVYL